MTAPFTCLHCNARLDRAAVVCPVCGESIRGRGAVTPSASATPVNPIRVNPAPANRRVALIVLGVMLACAATALYYALWTQGQRRANDAAPPARPARSPFDTIASAPDQLPALRYLPPGLEILVGVHFTTLHDDPATRALLEQPIPVGTGRIRLADLRGWLGLEPAVLDHAVLGLTPGKGSLPRVVLVARTRVPYDAEAVRRAMQATEVVNASPGEKKTLWNVRPGGLTIPALLWLADERTLVLSLTDLADVPVPDAEKLPHLSDTLRELLRERLDSGSAVWAVGRLRDGLRGPVGLVTNGLLDSFALPPEERAALVGMQTFAVGVVPGKEIVCRLDVELDKASGAEAIVRRLRGPQPVTNPKAESDGPRVLVQWKTTLEHLRGLLER